MSTQNFNQCNDSGGASHPAQAQVADLKLDGFEPSFEHDGQVAVTVAAMRCAADLLEQVGIAELSVTCYTDQLSVQVPDHLGGARERAAIVAALAEALGSIAYQHATPNGQHCWLRACGVIRGIQTTVSTTVGILRGEHGRIAITAEGEQIELTDGSRLPSGHHWLTELDTQADSRAQLDDYANTTTCTAASTVEAVIAR